MGSATKLSLPICCAQTWQHQRRRCDHRHGCTGPGVAAIGGDKCCVCRFWPVREYPWGSCEALSSRHSDLAALKKLLFEVTPCRVKLKSKDRADFLLIQGLFSCSSFLCLHCWQGSLIMPSRHAPVWDAPLSSTVSGIILQIAGRFLTSFSSCRHGWINGWGVQLCIAAYLACSTSILDA